jgi:hypothetical protein
MIAAGSCAVMIAVKTGFERDHSISTLRRRYRVEEVKPFSEELGI